MGISSSESEESDVLVETEESEDEYNPPVKKKAVEPDSAVKKKYKPQLEKYECWSMFVNFSQFKCKTKEENIFSKKWNPYQASLQYVAVYLDVMGFSEEELGSHIEVLGWYLPSLELEKKALKDILDLNDEKLLVPAWLKGHLKFTNSFRVRVGGLKIWNSFVESCLEKHCGKSDPFHADAKQVKDFVANRLITRDQFMGEAVDKIGLLAVEDFYVQNITNFCNHLGKYLNIVHCGTDLLMTKPIEELLLAGKHLDSRIPFKDSELAPHYDYTQYNAHNQKNEKFWEMGLVKTILKDVKTAALTKSKAAWQLGVTEDMIITALQAELKNPDFNLTLGQYLKKGYGNEQQFWVELSTVEILNEVRDRILPVENAAFMYGVSRSKLWEKVGRIKSEDEIKEEKEAAAKEKRMAVQEKKVNKPTQLQMQIKMAEDNFKNLSDYEKMRLENLRERQALLDMLNIAEDKKALRNLTISSKSSQPIDYGRREKSTRIKRKMEEFVPQISVASMKISAQKSPKWVGLWYPKSRGKSQIISGTNHIPIAKEDFNEVSHVPQIDLDMKEVFSSNTDYHKSEKFINCISEELKDVTEEIVTKNPFKEITKIADSKVCNSDIRSVDSCGDLVCYGDSSGCVGVYMAGRSTSLKIHNKPVTRTLFVGDSQGKGILSSALDGTVRLTDLTKQKVVVKYSWIQGGEKENIGWIEPWEGTNFLMNSNRNSVKRIDLRSKKVDTIVSLTDDDLSHLSDFSSLKWDEFDYDPRFGTNIGVHPTNTNLISFCHEFCVKIFDLRNTSKPVNTINVHHLHPAGEEPPYLYTRGISGANWSPGSGKYFLACPVKQKMTTLDAKQFHKPYIFDSNNLTNLVQTWPAMKDKHTGIKNCYETASFSHNFGASWCPWDEGMFLTTSHRPYLGPDRPGIPTRYTVVGVDAATGGVVAEIHEDLDNLTYLLHCHKSRNWVVVGNARGPGDLVIYQAGE